METTEITAFALGTPNAGELNQLYGAFRALSELLGTSQKKERMFLLPKGMSDVSDLKDTVSFSKYADYDSFKADVYGMLDVYFQSCDVVPRVFITAYNQSENECAGRNTDAICRIVKEYYQDKKLGDVFTTVLTSRLHKYKYVDLINIPKHLLTFTSRIRLLQDSRLRKKSLITIGTINNFSRQVIQEKNKDFLDVLKTSKADESLNEIVKKLEHFVNMPKKAVVCLGGRVEGPEIVFNISYAKKLCADAEKLVHNGYAVAFVNGPRTPNDVTDFLYERVKNNPNILFHNCKKIAEDDEDRMPKRWRIYSGPHEEDFKNMQKIGNIYPAILGFKNTLVVHTMDSYASCETANAAVPTAISCKGIHVDPDVRYDCHNLVQLLCPKYAIDWDEFVHITSHMKIEPKALNPQVLSSPLRVFAEAVVNRINARR